MNESDMARLGEQARRQIEGKLGTAKKSKYHNCPDSRGALHFDSRKEAQRYDELMLMLRAGEIRNLKLQPQFTLQEAYTTIEGVRVRAIRYQADFSYEIKSGWRWGLVEKWALVVEDVKSSATKTRQYELKKKLMQERFEISVVEV